MTTFDNREKAYENKFAHDTEMGFKASIRATKLLGEWAGGQIGMSTQSYVSELVNLVIGGKNEEFLIGKIHGDASGRGKSLSKEALSEKYSQCLSEAREHVLSH